MVQIQSLQKETKIRSKMSLLAWVSTTWHHKHAMWL